MLSGRRPQEGGYTMVELMVVLAVSVALVASAVALFNTRIPQAQFSNALSELETKVRGVANDVANGYYPNQGAAQGQDENRIFLGRLIQFSPAETGCSTSAVERCDQLRIFTVFGDRETELEPTSQANLNNANPRILDFSDSAPEDYTAAYGLHITGFANGTSSAGIAFLQSFGSPANVAGNPSGTPQVELYRQGGNMGQTSYDASSIVNTDDRNPDNGVVLCLRSGNNRQFAIMTIGANRSPGTVTTEILSRTEWNNRGCSV